MSTHDTHENDSAATGGEGAATSDLADLRAQAKALTADLPGPLARIKLTLGEASLEVEWQAPPAAAVVAVPQPMAPGGGAPVSGAAAASAAAPASAAVGEATAGGGEAAYGLSVVPDVPDGTPVEAPLVGTFYRAGAPEDPPFVEVGDRVEAGQQVAILEAMKLLNSIEAPVSGTVSAIVAGNGEMVEFGQVLLYIQEG